MKPQHFIAVSVLSIVASLSAAQQTPPPKVPVPNLNTPPTLESLASPLLNDPVILAKIGVTATQISESSLRKGLQAFSAGYSAGLDPDKYSGAIFGEFMSSSIIPWKSLNLDQQVALRRIVVVKSPNGALQLPEVQNQLKVTPAQHAKLWEIYSRKQQEYLVKMTPTFTKMLSKLSEISPQTSEVPSPEKVDEFVDKILPVIRSLSSQSWTPETLWPEFKVVLTAAQLKQFLNLPKIL